MDDGVSFADQLTILGRSLLEKSLKNPDLGPLTTRDYTFRRPDCDNETLGRPPEQLPRKWYKSTIKIVFSTIIDALDNPNNAFTQLLVNESTRGKGKGASAGMSPEELLGCSLQFMLKFKKIIGYEDLTTELKELYDKKYLDVYDKKLNLVDYKGKMDQGPLGENTHVCIYDIPKTDLITILEYRLTNHCSLVE